MSAITAALSQIDGVASEGDLVPDPAAPLELETAGEPILLPDGKRIYPPSLHGQPIDELALALLDMNDPAQSSFLRLARPARARVRSPARWTDLERHRPVGDTGRHEPGHPDAIVAAELERALDDSDPLRGIAQLAARFGAVHTRPRRCHPHEGARNRADGT